MKSSCCDRQHVPRAIQQPLSELTARLKEKSRKITGPRQAILDVLRRHQHPVTNKEIHAALASDGCDLATIYRNMHTLAAMGMVQRFDFGDGIARWELVTQGDDGHHHHLVCTRCSVIIEIDDCLPDGFEKALAARHGFTQITHKLEFFGVCSRCTKAALPSAVNPSTNIDPVA